MCWRWSVRGAHGGRGLAPGSAVFCGIR
jgi:hypothetical protein